MSDQKTQFLAKAEVKAQDLEHKRKLRFNIEKYAQAVVKGKTQFADLEVARKMAKNRKWMVAEKLDEYLEIFEKNFVANGGKVIWAETAQDALEAVGKICKERKARQVVKSKSMVTEEIHLNDYLKTQDIESIETDLGEYIQQLDGEAPYHIVTPAMHKSKEDVARLFHEKLGVPPRLSPPELTQIARTNLREKYLEAEIGLTGGNFLVADIGAVALTENEGNARLTTAFPKTHIAIVGIEKLIPSVEDLPLFWPLLATYGTGQKLTVYNTLFRGPRKPDETDGPEEMFVILLDNGRTRLMAGELRESLYCIRCGSCLNVCPVYMNIGGHAYGTTYSGPIGSVISPHLKGMGDFGHLSHSSSLCGACTEACPVNINIHGMLHTNRKLWVEQGHDSLAESLGWKLWKRSMQSRRILNMAGAGTKRRMFSALFSRSWGAERKMIEFAPQSFSELWKERSKKSNTHG